MSILDFIILVPSLACIAIAVGAAPRVAALAAAGINFALGFLAWFLFPAGEEGFHFVASRPVAESLGLHYAVGVDGISLVMVLLTVIVTLCAIWMSKVPESNAKLYFISLLLISLGALGAFCSTDVFFLYAFHELALIPTFLMIGIWGSGQRKAVAWKITLYLALGSVILLVGLLGLVIQLSGDAGLTFDLATLKERAAAGGLSEGSQNWIYLTLLIGFGVLISLFPFHSWAAPAYASAPVPTTMLHAGVLKKFGLYGLVRFAPMLPAGAETWLTLLVVLLLGNILVIGLATIAQKQLDTMLGYSSVMHMGYIFLGIASLNSIGLTGAVLLMFAHGVSIALLFALCGYVKERYGTLQFDELGGLARYAPGLTLLFGLGAFASVGLPGFANFSGEALVFFGGFADFTGETGIKVLQVGTILAIWGVVISAVYMLRAYRTIFFGNLSEDVEAGGAGDLALVQRIPFFILIAALLLIGFWPDLFSRLFSF
ncbi:MAG: NADH-quinone oxidoreductase subunit M [Verrucomicrobiota bacterium]